MEKGKLKPLYSELQGYLSQAPALSDERNSYIYDESVWNQYNECINLLNQTSGKDYTRFCITPKSSHGGSTFVLLTVYRQKLGGLITRLHAEYFVDELAPFSGSPSTIISQNQQQTQSFHVQMLLDIQSKIDEKIPNCVEGSKEKSFLQKFKKSLGSVSNAVQLLNLFIKLAKEFGLNIDNILQILS